ncbi:MAG: hypothetical protein V3S80_09940 [Sulfurimonadaceae bacterium]
MKKYIASNGFKFKGDYNDMTDKQFYLSSAAYADGENSTYGNLVLDMQETYVLFLKHFEPTTFKTKLESIINDANADGLCATLGNAIEVDRQENGYMITMNFITRGD